jgi:hypothetical protein
MAWRRGRKTDRRLWVGLVWQRTADRKDVARGCPIALARSRVVCRYTVSHRIVWSLWCCGRLTWRWSWGAARGSLESGILARSRASISPWRFLTVSNVREGTFRAPRSICYLVKKDSPKTCRLVRRPRVYLSPFKRRTTQPISVSIESVSKIVETCGPFEHPHGLASHWILISQGWHHPFWVYLVSPIGLGVDD